MYSFKKYKNFLNENNYLTFDDLVFKYHPQLNTEFDEINFNNGYVLSVFRLDDKYLPGYLCFVHKRENNNPIAFALLTKEEVSEKMIELQKRKEKKRIFTAEDPYGEEDWNDDDNISENLDQKEKITTVQLWNEYLRKGRKYVMDKLRDRDIEFVTKSKKVKKYKGKICGFVPAFLYSDKEIIILFDTKEYGVLKVNDKYPIILNPKSEYEDEDDE